MIVALVVVVELLEAVVEAGADVIVSLDAELVGGNEGSGGGGGRGEGGPFPGNPVLFPLL